MQVYRLTHEYYNTHQDCDIVTSIAVYSSLEKAEKALEKFKKYKKFSNHPDGFYIGRYEVDKTEWQEGFIPF